MQRYKNSTGDSGVVAYEIAARSILIKFRDGGIYLYDYTKPGRIAVEVMKKLATHGSELATFINKYVRNNYAQKIS